MKNIREEYIVDKFVDYLGAERTFVLAAISEDLTGTEEAPSTAFTILKGEDGKGECDIEVIAKRLMFGLAVCDPNDEFDEELGKKMAKGRAINPKSRISTLLSTDKGLINTSVVRATLKQEAEYLKQNPGKYIKSYNEDKEVYEYGVEMEGRYQAMTEAEKNAVAVLTELSEKDINKLLEVVNHLR